MQTVSIEYETDNPVSLLVNALKLCQVRIFMHEGSENMAYQAADYALNAYEKVAVSDGKA